MVTLGQVAMAGQDHPMLKPIEPSQVSSYYSEALHRLYAAPSTCKRHFAAVRLCASSVHCAYAFRLQYVTTFAEAVDAAIKQAAFCVSLCIQW